MGPKLRYLSLITHLFIAQLAAVGMAMANPLSIITGGPGTGKTFVLRVAVEIWRQLGKRVLLAAPTGRAAARMNEVSFASYCLRCTILLL